MNRAAATAALIAALALLAYRFCNLDLAAFILDEPVFLRAAAAEVSSGHWLSASPIRGSTGVTYGPTVFWFYACVQTLFGPSAATAILAMCVMMTAAHLALAWALTDFFDGDRWTLAALIGWIAASPYQFFWSRLAWDQSVDIAAAWVVVLLTRRATFSIARGLWLGGVLGLGVSSHLMIAPLFALSLAWLIYLRAWRALAACSAAITVINVPYLRELLSMHVASAAPQAMAWHALGAQLIQPLRVSSLLDISYFFDAQWAGFAALHPFIDESAALSLLVLSGLTMAGLVVALRRDRTRAFACFALALWLLTAVFHLACHLELQPHYMFASYWVVGFGLAAVLSTLRQRARHFALISLGLVFCAHALFLTQWMSFIRAHEGTHGIHYGAALGAQMRLVRESCERHVPLNNSIAPFAISLEYIADHEPACSK